MESLQIRRSGSKIEAKIPWSDGQGPIEAKKIKGYRYNRDNRTWFYPLKWESAVGLRKAAIALGVELKMTDGIRKWGHEEKARLKREESRGSRTAKTVDDHDWLLEKSHPEIFSAISARPFQREGILFGLDKRRMLLADDPGLGKTLQTIGMMIEGRVRGPILVVANKSASSISWPNEIRKWAPDDVVMPFGAFVKPAAREKFFREIQALAEKNTDRRIWVITNPEWVQAKAETDAYGNYVYSEGKAKVVTARQPEFFGVEWGAIICDESHETLAAKTNNAKKWSQRRQGLGLLETTDDGIRLSISGTPMRGRPENMFGHLQWLEPSEYTSFWNWAKEHFVVEKSDSAFGSGVELASLKCEKEFYRGLSGIMLRRAKGEVASDLPPKQYAGTAHPDGDVVGVWLPMDTSQKRQYEKFVESQSVVDENGAELDAVGILAIYTRMRQLANSSAEVVEELQPMPVVNDQGTPLRDRDGKKLYERDEDGNKLLFPVAVMKPTLPSNKYEWLKEWLTERDLIGKGAKGSQKVIIASQFKKMIDLMREDLEVNHGVASFAITGDTSAQERVRQQDEFQNNPDSPRLFFLQSKAGGTSLTLDMADDVIIVDEMWDPDVQLQIEDRAHRLSRHHNVTIWYLRSLDTIEEKIGVTVEERMDTCRGVLDRSRGIDIAKKLMS